MTPKEKAKEIIKLYGDDIIPEMIEWIKVMQKTKWKNDIKWWNDVIDELNNLHCV